MEWISVKDKLPEPCIGLIVWNGKYVYDDIQMLENGEFWTHVYGYDYDSHKIENITHWMYLPEPPKRVKNSVNKINLQSK